MGMMKEISTEIDEKVEKLNYKLDAIDIRIEMYSAEISVLKHKLKYVKSLVILNFATLLILGVVIL